MGLKEKLPLLNSSRKLVRLFGYVVYTFVILILIGIILPSPEVDDTATEHTTEAVSLEESGVDEVVGTATESTTEVEEKTEVDNPTEKDVEKMVGKQKSILVSDDAAMNVFRTSLRDVDISGITTQVANGRANGGTKSLVVSYKSSATTAEGMSEEIGSVLGAFLGTVLSGWDCDELSAVIGDSKGNAIGMWYCSKAWKDRYIKGTMTNEEIMLKVLGTVQTL